MDDHISEFFGEVKEIIRVRGKTYGIPEENFARIASMWADYLGIPVEPFDVAIMMSMLKLARLSEGYHRDSIVDAVSYLTLADRFADDQ